MKLWFVKQGYRQNMINREIGRAKFCENKQNNNKSVSGVLFVIRYHPMVKSLGKILHDNIHLLCKNEEVRRTFTPGPMISSRHLVKLVVIWLGLNYTHLQELQDQGNVIEKI